MWEIDVSAWDGDNEQISTWFARRSTDDYRAIISVLKVVVLRCPYTETPARGRAYAEMTVEQFHEVCARVDAAVSNLYAARRKRMSTTYTMAQSFPYAGARAEVPEGRITADSLIDRALVHRANIYALCKEFGWTVEYVENLDPFVMNEILGYMDGVNEYRKSMESKA